MYFYSIHTKSHNRCQITKKCKCLFKKSWTCRYLKTRACILHNCSALSLASRYVFKNSREISYCEMLCMSIVSSQLRSHIRNNPKGLERVGKSFRDSFSIQAEVNVYRTSLQSLQKIKKQTKFSAKSQPDVYLCQYLDPEPDLNPDNLDPLRCLLGLLIYFKKCISMIYSYNNK
jgi:hypothetical protein